MQTNDYKMMDVHTKVSKPKAKSKNCTIIKIGHMDDLGLRFTAEIASIRN